MEDRPPYPAGQISPRSPAPVPFSGTSDAPARYSQQPPAWVAPSPQQPLQRTPPRRTKAESLDLIRRIKGWLVAGAVVGFGVLGLLVKGSVASVAAASSITSSQSPSSSTQQPSSGGFFGQQGGSHFGSSNSGDVGGSFGSSSTS